MKLRFLAASAALACLIAGPAFASQHVPITVELKAPIAQPVRIIVGDVIWSCSESRCVAPLATIETFSNRVCKTLVRKVGPVASFTSQRRGFEPAELDRCNAVAG